MSEEVRVTSKKGEGNPWIFWSILAMALLLPRVLLQTALPVYLFSDDAHSYLLSAFHWTQTGDWETSSRRGAIYSLLIAGCLHFFQSLDALVPVQHLIGGGAVLLCVVLLRALAPAKLFWPSLGAAVALALCGYVIYFENLVRSEIVLFLFSALALTSWGLFLHKKQTWLLGLAGAGFALATLVKNMLLPFPVLVVIFLFLERGVSWTRKARRVAVLLVGIALPLLGEKVLNSTSGHRPAPAPQSGILLYGRVAQWTVLDGGSQPEIKALIRDDIEAYRKLPKLNNNVILKRTAVPKIYAWVAQKHGSEAEVNRICKTMAVEAIRTHLSLWGAQVVDDIRRLHWKMDFPMDSPTADDLADARLSTTKMKHQHPMLKQQETLDFLAHPGLVDELRPFHFITAASWLFLWHPVLLTTLLLPLLIFLDRDAIRRPFWITAAAVWYFDLAIICTVGRPIPRYLMAAVPVMFWVLAGGFLHAVTLLVRWIKSRQFFGPPDSAS